VKYAPPGEFLDPPEPIVRQFITGSTEGPIQYK
jgi:hypothetical protein